VVIRKVTLKYMLDVNEKRIMIFLDRVGFEKLLKHYAHFILKNNLLFYTLLAENGDGLVVFETS